MIQQLPKKAMILMGAGVLSGAATSACAADNASANPAADKGDQLQEIVVTAERRESDVQKTALAVTVIPAEKLSKEGIQTFDKLLEDIPGIQVQDGQAGPITPNVAIRGLGTDGQNKPGATSIYLDGILTGNLGAELYDLSRVEVLRGPQGTLYGGSATGGAVNIISNDPSLAAFGSSGTLEVGGYGLVHATAVMNAPLTDTVAVRAAVNTVRRNSYADSADEFNSQTNARLKILAKPVDGISLLFGGEFYSLNGVTNDGYSLVDPTSGRPYGAYSPVTGNGLYQGYRVYANLKFDVGIGTLTNLTSIEKTHNNPSAYSLALGAYTTLQPHNNTTIEELRLTSNPSSPVSWVVGFWSKHYFESQSNLISVGTGLPIQPADLFITTYEDDRWQQNALYAQMTVPITNATRFTVGARASNDQVKYNQYLTWEPVAGSFGLNCGTATAPSAVPCTVPTLYEKNSSRGDWLARLEQDLSPDHLLYVMASTGYRPGGNSAPRSAYEQPNAFYAAESVEAFEIGSKNRFGNNRYQLNGDVYLNRYPAFQNEIINVEGSAQIPSVISVPARFYGAELEFNAALSTNDRMTATASYIHANYTGNAQWVDPFTEQGAALNTTGATVPHAPKYQFSLDYSHTVPFSNGGELTLDANGHYQTQQAVGFDPCLYSQSACALEAYFTPPYVVTSQQIFQRAYTMANATATYTTPGGRFSASIYCHNCSNQVLKTYIQGNGWYSLAPLRTFGVIFNVNL